MSSVLEGMCVLEGMRVSNNVDGDQGPECQGPECQGPVCRNAGVLVDREPLSLSYYPALPLSRSPAHSLFPLSASPAFL